jgi:SAM-dependent methyltransferase
MAHRTAASHAAFFLPYLRPGMRLLDCGCGPGTLTEGLAAAVAPGPTIGIDADPHEAARAAGRGIPGATFTACDATALPFHDAAFDAVHAHALLEHVRRPEDAVAEMRRVLAPGGVIGVATPDWGGFLLIPPDAGAQAALEDYEALQRAREGGDPRVGRRLGALLEGAGLRDVRTAARYENHPSAVPITAFLAEALEADGDAVAGAALREWGARPGALFAQSWVSAVGRAPG